MFTLVTLDKFSRRQLRSLSEFKWWKATEFRQFLLYTDPVVLKDVIEARYYKHFLSLSVAIHILILKNSTKRNHYLQQSKELLRYFVSNAEELYWQSFSSYNIHCLLHLPDDVLNFNTYLDELSCFPFEHHLQRIKRMIRSTKNQERISVTYIKEPLHGWTYVGFYRVITQNKLIEIVEACKLKWYTMKS